MTTKVRTNRTKQVTATDGTALVVLDADESRPDFVAGHIRWRSEGLVEFPDGIGRSALRHLANAILEAVDASEWPVPPPEVEAPATPESPDRIANPLRDLGFKRALGDRPQA